MAVQQQTESEWLEQEALRERMTADHFNAYVREGGKIQSMTWKHEGANRKGAYGPVMAYAAGVDIDALPRSIQWGDPDPEGVWTLPWQHRSFVRKLAKHLGARLTEY